MRTSSSEVLIELDRSRARGLRVQIEDQLRGAIRSGRLATGSALPSSRAARRRPRRHPWRRRRRLRPARRRGLPRVGAGGRDIVKAAAARPTTPATDLRRTARRSPSTSRSFAPTSTCFRTPHGCVPPSWRSPRCQPTGSATSMSVACPSSASALVDYLGRVRGVSADIEKVMITNGFSHSVTVISTALERLGHDVIAVEDPHRCAEDQLGLSTAPDPRRRGRQRGHRRGRSPAVDGASCSRHPRPPGTDGHRHVATAATRADRVGTRRRRLRHRGRLRRRVPLRPPSGRHVAGHRPDRVVYCGTSSKNVAPGLRLGWLILPPRLVEPFVRVRRGTDLFTSSILQAVFAAFVSSGDLDRHLRRSRRLYRQRRDALVESLARWLPEATTTGISAGLHLVLCLPPGTDECAVVDHALAAGVDVTPRRVPHRPAVTAPAGAGPRLWRARPRRRRTRGTAACQGGS